MRTTVTLDDDVAAKLKEEARRQKTSFKEILNTSVRRGLRASSPAGVKPYRLRPQPLRARPDVDLDRALALAGELEDAEILRKLSLRK
ncbi:MAG TPA: ribbon-helix-helix protein, CopG family [Solirubrobacterales bacterium]|nr:ribbon-helix-helix protein, CopG family [Solirubrobacterales bacterium]